MKWVLPILAFALILTGCDSSGELRVKNDTKHLLFFTIDGSSYEVPDSGSVTVELDVDKDWEIFDTNAKNYDLLIEGETFLIYAGSTSGYTNETQVEIEDGKTLDVYAAPTHACVKVINNCDVEVARVLYDRYKDGLLQENNIPICDEGVPPGTSWYYRLTPSSDSSDISYAFTVELEDGSSVQYPASILDVDDQFLIELN